MNSFILFALAGLALVTATPTPKFDAEIDVGLNLYTRLNPSTPQVLINGDVQVLQNSNFQLDKPVKMFAHGWTKQAIDPSVISGFLADGDYNVILIDWTKGTDGEESEVVARVPSIGKFLGSFIDWLSTLGVDHSKFHIVGMSLGSHVVGWTGRSCQKGKVEIVTACDPPKRFWEDSDDKVNAGDGKYVEVIHSNTLNHGLIYPTGTADFYPNGGTTQPGCNNNSMCDHGRSLQFLMDSLGHQGFVAKKCNSYEEMAAGNCANIGTSYMGGTGAAKNISGVYYLTTNANKPYYQG